MFDTHMIARQLSAAGLSTEQADAITDAIRQAAEHRAADLATRGELYRVLLQTFAILGGVIALLRFLLP